VDCRAVASRWVNTMSVRRSRAVRPNSATLKR
jgi:hypothetical protein